MTVTAGQSGAGGLSRHLQGSPCPVCGGHAGLPHGKGIRCAGFTLAFVTYCTREQFAGRLPLDLGTDPPTYRHRLFGRCDCGVEHGGDAPLPAAPRVVQQDPHPVLPVATRSAIYERALDLLTLRPEALGDLTRRGLSPTRAHDMGYRSIPRRGREHRAFLAALVDEFGEPLLRQCPGFADKNRRLTFWTASSDRDGYVVTYRDEVGRVTGLQMKVIGGRYLTATGTRLEAVYHVSGVSTGADIYLTEGATKADVAHTLGGVAVFAVAGQSLKPSHIDAIKRLSPRRVIVALDEEDNTGTDRARERWLRLLAEAGLSAYRAVWEGSDVGGPKGLDDLFHSGGRPRVRAVHLPSPEFGNRRRPYAVEQPGLVDRGSSLQEARGQTARAIDRFVEDAWKNAGKSQLVASSPGAGKSTALAHAIQRHRTAARVLVGTKALAAELAEEHGYILIAGRGPDNCERPDVVRTLGEAGHDVERLACGTRDEPRCPARSTCGYWAQFQQPGPRVAATEQLFNPHFLAGGSVIALDDAELLRSLVSRCSVPASVITNSIQQLERRHREPVRRVLRLLAHAVTDAPERPLIGPATWDHLAKTAARYSCDLGALLRALPKEGTLPEPDADVDGYISVATVDGTPPATLLLLLDALRTELTAFESADDFNSSLRLSSSGIDVWTLREPVPDRHGVPIAPHMALLVMDATPVEPLVRHVMRDHQRLPDVQARIRLPENVTVAQYASTSNGHAVLADEAKLRSVLDEVIDERARHPVGTPAEEAVVVFKRHRKAMTAAGFTPEQVLSYGSLRGTNALTGVRRLHIVGRPMPPGDDLVFLAQAIHHDEAPVSGRLTLASRTYGGQRAAIDVIDFDDLRVSALLRATRDDELTQVIHRARLLTLQPQLEFGGGDQREHVRVVLHTNHVIPGLRIDELHVAGGCADVNQQREQDAGRRIASAVASLIAAGEPLTVSAVARAAGAQRRTVSKALGKGLQTLSSSGARITTTDPTKEVGTPVHTLRRDLYKGVHTLPQSIEPPPESHSSAVDGGTATPLRVGYAPCRGGCGQQVPLGQKCSDCAARAVEEWRLTRRRKPAVAGKYRPGSSA